jgi:hypothetical protein
MNKEEMEEREVEGTNSADFLRISCDRIMKEEVW